MCMICELEESDDPRQRMLAQTLRNPHASMQTALALNYLMQRYGLTEFTVPGSFSGEGIPMLMGDPNPDGGITFRVVAEEQSRAIAESVMSQHEPHTVQ